MRVRSLFVRTWVSEIALSECEHVMGGFDRVEGRKATQTWIGCVEQTGCRVAC